MTGLRRGFIENTIRKQRTLVMDRADAAGSRRNSTAEIQLRGETVRRESAADTNQGATLQFRFPE
jgi:hypothetical protein